MTHEQAELMQKLAMSVDCCLDLDAAKALHEAVLPGWHYSIDGRTEDECEAEVFTPPEPAPKPWHCATIIRHQHDAVLNMHNPARAWLIAILRALYAQEADT